MKQPAFVFGVSLLAACAAHPKQPLYATDGSPACGNIGQTGRAPCELRAEIAPSAATVTPHVEHVALVASPPSRGRPLLAPRATREELTVARPLVTQEDRAAAGNVMGKATPEQLERSARAAQQLAVTPPTSRPLLTREQRPATGNVRGKSDDDMDDGSAVQRPLMTTECRPAAGNVKTKRPSDMSCELPAPATRVVQPVKHEASAAERRARRAARRAAAARIEAERAAHEAHHDAFQWQLPVGAEQDLATFEAEPKGRK